MKALIATTALLFATTTWAECPGRLPAEKPSVPDGNTASHEAMYEAQVQVKAYVTTIENYLACRGSLHHLQRNRSLSLALKVAKSYNDELANFRERANVVAGNQSATP